MSGVGGGGAGLMSCVREGSLEPPYRPPHVDQHTHGEGRTGRFLRGLRRMFKRRGSGSRVDSSPDPKSSSTSELLDAERHARRKEGAYGSGLSVSHDSVFTGERSGDESGDERPTPAHTLAQLANTHRAELVAAVRRRGRGDDDDDDEDLGLPRSPPASPPTDKADKRHHAGISQSSCSDGSLLSVGSSEMDEDSSSGHHHSHDHSNRSDNSDFYNSSEPPSGVAPLSHSAAKHKMAVRPRRTHGAPRRRKNTPITAKALPITPELNEELIRSTTPEIVYHSSEVVTESYSSSKTMKHQIISKEQLLNRELQKVLEAPNDTKLKSSSLPPGLALNQLAGQTPVKLSIAEENTPRSSIKRSKSSTQGQPLRDGSPKSLASTSESLINEERMAKYRVDNKYTEECLEKKSKSEKKIENDAIRSSKKEESFFSRWLMRKSAKKTKKDQPDEVIYQEIKKSKMEKPVNQYKPVETERIHAVGDPGPKPVPAERTHKSAGQKAFANQMHKRIDNKGAYVKEGVYKESVSSAKVSSVDSNISDLKKTEVTENLHIDIKNRFSRREEFNEKIDKDKKMSYNIRAHTEENKRESFNLHHDISKRPASVQRLVEPFSSKSFISNELASLEKEKNTFPSLHILDDEPPIKAVRIKKTPNDNVFHSGSMPKNIPYFNPNITVTDNASPPKKIHHSSENVKHTHRSSEFLDREKEVVETKREKSCRISKTDESYLTSGLRSLGEEFVEHRSSIGKSQSFRYASESTSISSHDSQMPSLPAIVGISEPLDNWGVDFRNNITDRNDLTKRLSARNYNIIPSSVEPNFDSLPSSDSSYQDSLKTDLNDDAKKFTNSIHITLDSDKRDSVISQIEARIYDLISSPKPIMAPILKSSSLDSVKSSPEKVVDDRRKTIAVESTMCQNVKSVQSDTKRESEAFISVTHINKEQCPITINNTEIPKLNKSDEKLQKLGSSKPGVPEFLFLQLNKVDPKPTTHVVLTANVTPKKIDSPQTEKEQDTFEVTGTKPNHSEQVRRESLASNKAIDNITELEVKQQSPVIIRKSIQPIAPLSPSTPRPFFKKKSISVDMPDKEKNVKSRNNSLSTEGSNEKIHENLDQKSHSSFGSKTSIQSIDSNEIKAPDRNEEAVIFRKKPIKLTKEPHGDKKNDDEPELMKVFARRSLKLKDSDVENITQDICNASSKKDEVTDQVNATRSKVLKNEFNASIKSRDSDKENDDTLSKDNEENRSNAIAARVSQFGNLGQHYQRSVSINSVANSNLKRESAPTFRNDINKYKKEVSDSTPEKRLRNRTFPELSNDREDMKVTRNEAMAYKDTLPKKSWQKKETTEKENRENAVIERDGDKEKDEESKEKGAEGEADEALQFKCIFERRAEWEKRASQGMTK